MFEVELHYNNDCREEKSKLLTRPIQAESHVLNTGGGAGYRVQLLASGGLPYSYLAVCAGRRQIFSIVAEGDAI
jgi:hypothetical protein